MADDARPKPFPQTHRSAHAQATYEQCPWDQEHVEAIYRNLLGAIILDEQWHPIPVDAGHIGQYRVSGNRYFQAIYAATPNPVFEALTRMDPLETQDDAEWAIWEEGGVYVLSSTFALTPGQFAHQPAVDDWLSRY